MAGPISFYSDFNCFRFLVGSDGGFVQIQLDEIPGNGFERFLVSLPINLFALLPDRPRSGKGFLQFMNRQVTAMPSGEVPLLQNSVNRGADVERRAWRFLDSGNVTEVEL